MYRHLSEVRDIALNLVSIAFIKRESTVPFASQAAQTPQGIRASAGGAWAVHPIGSPHFRLTSFQSRLLVLPKGLGDREIDCRAGRLLPRFDSRLLRQNRPCPLISVPATPFAQHAWLPILGPPRFFRPFGSALRRRLERLKPAPFPSRLDDRVPSRGFARRALRPRFGTDNSRRADRAHRLRASAAGGRHRTTSAR